MLLASVKGPASQLIEYLVVAGGGGGGNPYGSNYAGAGGAGGLFQNTININSGADYLVVIGAGGAIGANGSDSVFSLVTATGGGYGGGGIYAPGGNGGSGGGSGTSGNVSSGIAPMPGGLGVAGQGYNGGTGGNASRDWCPGFPEKSVCASLPGGGGGGGAGGPGSNGGIGSGGPGVTSTITNAVFSTGGSCPQGTYYAVWTATPGPAGTGNGGSGGQPAMGGSGIIVLRYPAFFDIQMSGGGLTMTTSTVGTNKVTQITAGTGNIRWA
jgi:hypothetical protein